MSDAELPEVSVVVHVMIVSPSGNTSTLFQSVYLIDSISPRIAFTDDLTIEAYDLSENLVELITPESSD